MELAAIEYLKRLMFPIFLIAIDTILFNFACNEAIHNILDEFEFQPD